MGWFAWIVLGAIAGWLAGLLVKGDEGLGVIGHIVLGILGGVIGGYIVTAMTGDDPMKGALNIGSIVVAVVGAVVLVLVVSLVMGRTRAGRGPI